MAAWARSTGAILPRCRYTIAAGSSRFRAATNLPRVAPAASAGRGRQTSTMLEARALVPMLMDLAPRSVRMGQVPLTPKPALITASRKVSHPVEAVPASPELSDCLKA